MLPTVYALLSHLADGASNSQAFQNAAVVAGFRIIESVTISPREVLGTFAPQFTALRQSRSQVIVVLCDISIGGEFIRKATAAGVGGEGFLWMLGSSLAIPALWESDVGTPQNPGMATDLALRDRVLKGVFALAPFNGAGTDASNAYLDRRRQLPETRGENGTCNLETDDDGEYLW